MDFSENNINIFKSWISALSIPFNKNYKSLIPFHTQIYEYIDKKYTNENSKRVHLSSLAKLFKIYNGENSSLYKKYSKLAIKLQKQIELKNLSQEVNENRKDNYLTFNNILNKREEYKKLFLEHPEDHKINQQYLILCLYTMQPPIRQEYKDMKFVSSVPHDKTKNYILKKFDKYFVIINKDKISKNYTNKDLFELSSELCSTIDESLKYYPRKYILSLNTNGEKQIGKQGFEAILKSIFDEKRIGVDMIRSAYITHVYDNKKITMREKTEIASKMRSSIAMANTNYHKIVEHTEEDIINEFINNIKIHDKDQLKKMIINIISEIRSNENMKPV